MIKIIFLVAIIILFSSSTVHALEFDSLAQIEKQKYSSWYVGKNVFSQNYLYHICDFSIKPTLNYASPCYQVRLDFIDLLQEQNERYWIVQAIFTSDISHKNWFSILHISEDFATITSDGASMNYVTSLSHTLFYLQNYANIHKPQLLKIGTSWGAVNDYVSPIPELVVNKFVISNVGDSTMSVYQVGFVVSKYNVFFIQEKVPFPIESILYDSKSPDNDPRILYQIKSLNIADASKNMTGNKSFDTPEICSSLLLPKQGTLEINQSNSNLHPLNFENNATFGNLDRYTNQINSTTENQILQALKKVDGNFTLNSTN